MLTKNLVTSIAAALVFSLPAFADFLGENALYTGVRIPTKGEPGIPKSLRTMSEAFTVDGDELISNDEMREPASVRPQGKQKPHWSAAATEGFEFKIRVKQQLSAVWVLKRGERFDLIFASSGGSRVNLSIPAEQFYALKNAASDLRAPASDMSACKDSYVRLEMVEAKTRKSVSTCLNAKSKTAEEFRRFGSALAGYVR